MIPGFLFIFQSNDPHLISLPPRRKDATNTNISKRIVLLPNAKITLLLRNPYEPFMNRANPLTEAYISAKITTKIRHNYDNLLAPSFLLSTKEAAKCLLLCLMSSIGTRRWIVQIIFCKFRVSC